MQHLGNKLSTTIPDKLLPEYLAKLIPTNLNAADLRNKIMATLVMLKAHRSVDDLESLGHDIFVEAWEHHTPVTYQFIRHRLINRYHSRRHYSDAVKQLATLPPLESVDLIEVHSKLDQTIKLADVTPIELHVIFLVYYSGLTYDSTAERLHKSTPWVKQTLFDVLERLRKAGRWIEAREHCRRY